MPKKSIKIMGVTYESLREAYDTYSAKYATVSYEIFRRRLKQGMSVEDALFRVPERARNKTEIIIGGKKYESLVEAYEKLKPPISYETFIRRVNSGYNIEKLFVPRLPNSKKQVMYRGVVYSDYVELYNAMRPPVSYDTFQHRLRSGESIEKAMRSSRRRAVIDMLEKELGITDFSQDEINRVGYRISMGDSLKEAVKWAKCGPDGLVYKGTRYKNLTQLVEKNNIDIPAGTIYNRVRNGASLEEAINSGRDVLIIRPIAGKIQVEICGEIYESIAEAHRNLSPKGLSLDCVYSRLHAGYSLEAAVCTGLNRYEYKGKIFNSLAEIYRLARPENISYKTFLKRVESGESFEEALVYEDNRIEYCGIRYDSIAEMHKKLGLKISYSAFKKRIQHGMSLEEAVNNPPMPGKNNGEVTVNGVKYDSLYAAMCKLGIKLGYHTIENRMKAGWSIEQAMGLCAKPRVGEINKGKDNERND